MMKKILLYSFWGLFFVLWLPVSGLAQMGSDNYQIPTSVMSCGGGEMSSGNYQSDSTLGQPSPLMDPADPPDSASYELYPGFWYAVETEVVNVCEGDFDLDGDVDGSDLAVFAAEFGRTDCSGGPPCEGDFDHDGDVDGSDLATFAADFGRTDCPLPQ